MPEARERAKTLWSLKKLVEAETDGWSRGVPLLETDWLTRRALAARVQLPAVALNCRDFVVSRPVFFAEPSRPPFCTFAQVFHANSKVFCGKARDFYNTCSEQCLRAVWIAAAIVVKSGCDLYESLQKSLFRLGLGQPDFLPHFMRLEKFSRVEVPQTALKSFAFLAGVHCSLVQFPIEFRGGVT